MRPLTSASAAPETRSTTEIVLKITDQPPAPPRVRPLSPALPLACAFALGIAVVGIRNPESVLWWHAAMSLVAGAILSLIAAAMLIRRSRLRASAAAALAGFALAGGASAALFAFRLTPNDVSHLELSGIDTAQPLRVRGFLRMDPLPTPSGIEIDLDLAAIGPASATSWRLATGRLRLRVAWNGRSLADPERLYDLRYGDEIEAVAVLHRPQVYANPGDFDFRERAASIDDLYWEGSVSNADSVRALPGHRARGYAGVIDAARGRARRAIDTLYPPWSTEGRNGAVLKAMLLGDRTALDSATIDTFRASGLYHLLVIAGLHVGILAALVLGLCRLIGLGRTPSNLITLAALLAYAALVEQRAPTMRATLMLAAYVVAQILDRGHSATNAVAVAALTLLVVRPAYLFESGFQLSFAAALIIVAVAAPLTERTLGPFRRACSGLEQVDRDHALEPRAAQFRIDLRNFLSLLRSRSTFLDEHPRITAQSVLWPLRLFLWALEIAMFSAILQVGLLLPMVEQFHRVALIGVALNALAIPLMAVLLAAAVPTVMLAVVAPAVAGVPAKLVALILRALLALPTLPGLPHWLSYRVPSPPIWVAVGFALSLVGVAFALHTRQRALVLSAAAFAAFAVIIATAPFGARLPAGELEVTALDCGRGQSTLLVLPGQFTILMGAAGTERRGPSTTALAKRWDPGENVVSPYLWSRGIKVVNVLVASPRNLDGVASIIENFKVGEIWYSSGGSPLSPGLAAVLAEADRRHVVTRPIAAGEILRIGGSSVSVYGANSSPVGDPSSADDGDLTLVVRTDRGDAIRVGNNLDSGSTGKTQAETAEEVWVTNRAAFEQALHAGLANATPPRIVMLTPAPNAPELAETAAASLELSHILLFQTDRDGAITAELGGGHTDVHTYRGERQLWP